MDGEFAFVRVSGTLRATMARNANDTEPMSDAPEAGDQDDVDSMLNALQVSPERRKRGPEITPAPEAIAKARSGQGAQAGGKKRVAAQTVPMGNAPPLPKEVLNARVASDPAEQAFLNKTEERAPRRRRDEKTMLTGMKPPETPASGYLVSAGIAFVAVLAVGLIGWRVMKYMESQAPLRDGSADVRAVGNPANTTTGIAVPLTAKPVGSLALPATAANAGVPPVPATTDPVQAATTPAGTAATAPPNARPAGKPGAAASGASPAGSAPGGKYGGMVSPELQ